MLKVNRTRENLLLHSLYFQSFSSFKLFKFPFESFTDPTNKFWALAPNRLKWYDHLNNLRHNCHAPYSKETRIIASSTHCPYVLWSGTARKKGKRKDSSCLSKKTQTPLSPLRPRPQCPWLYDPQWKNTVLIRPETHWRQKAYTCPHLMSKIDSMWTHSVCEIFVSTGGNMLSSGILNCYYNI